MARILYSIILCFFGELEASFKRSLEDQPDPVFPIRSRKRVEKKLSDSHPVIAAPVSSEAGLFHMERGSIVEHMISFFSDTANAFVDPNENVFRSTEAHVRATFPSSQISKTEIVSKVRNVLRKIMIPNEALPFISGLLHPTAEQLSVIATNWGKSVVFVQKVISIWVLLQNKNFEEHPSMPGFLIFTRPTLLSYLRCGLRSIRKQDKQIEPVGKGVMENEVFIVLRYLMTNAFLSPSELLSLIKREQPMTAINLTDVERIRARLAQFAAELTEEHEAAQILAGFTQQRQAEILASLTPESL